MPTYTHGTVTPAGSNARGWGAVGGAAAGSTAAAVWQTSLARCLQLLGCPHNGGGSPAMWPSSTRSSEAWRPAWRGSTLRFQGSAA